MGFYVINEARSTEFTEASQLAHKAIKRRFKETWDLWIVLKRSNTIVGGVKERWSRMAQLAAIREMFNFVDSFVPVHERRASAPRRDVVRSMCRQQRKSLF